MLKLANKFYITSIKKYNVNKIDKSCEYIFKYKNFRVILKIYFTILGFSDASNIAIVNFGYLVDVEKFSNRLMRYVFIEDLDKNDGQSTKKYFDSKETREILVKFIEKNLSNYLANSAPTLLIRGTLSDIKANLPRYKRLDIPFFKNNYKKIVLKTNIYKSLHDITPNKDDKKGKVIWAYAKDEKYFKELENVFSGDWRF